MTLHEVFGVTCGLVEGEGIIIYKWSPHPSNVKLDPLYICWQILTNNLGRRTDSRSYKLTMVLNQFQKRNIQVAHYFMILCYMNDIVYLCMMIPSLRPSISIAYHLEPHIAITIHYRPRFLSKNATLVLRTI